MRNNKKKSCGNGQLIGQLRGQGHPPQAALPLYHQELLLSMLLQSNRGKQRQSSRLESPAVR